MAVPLSLLGNPTSPFFTVPFFPLSQCQFIHRGRPFCAKRTLHSSPPTSLRAASQSGTILYSFTSVSVESDYTTLPATRRTRAKLSRSGLIIRQTDHFTTSERTVHAPVQGHVFLIHFSSDHESKHDMH